MDMLPVMHVVTLFQRAFICIAHADRLLARSSTLVIRASNSAVQMIALTAYTVANAPLLDSKENMGASISPIHMVNDSVFRSERHSRLITGK